MNIKTTTLCPPRMITALLVLFSAPAAGPALGQCDPPELPKLIPSDADANDEFATAVGISGDTAVVGAPFHDHSGVEIPGSAYVFARSAGRWMEESMLIASDPAPADRFGESVAVSGDTAIVGASQNDDSGFSSGSAYIFARSNGIWTQDAKLTASDAGGGDWFGFSVAISGDTAVVGAHLDDHPGATNAGSAYVFVRSGDVWVEQEKLTASDAAADGRFGSSVAIAGDSVLIGANFDDHAGGINAGSGYVFVRSGDAWIEEGKLIASDAQENARFGTAVALSGDTAAVGAPFDTHPGGIQAGAAYIFAREASDWIQEKKLTAFDAAGSDVFGSSVAILDDTAVIGASQNDGFAGSAYLFVRSGGACVWTEAARITASDAAANDQFGFSVAISADTVMAGAYHDDHAAGINAGSAYAFELCGSLGPCPADLNCNGDVGLTDLLELLSDWGETGVPADIDGDGTVGLGDLLTVLVAWGPCF